MVNSCKKTAFLLLSLIFFTLSALPVAFASDASDTVKNFSNGGSEIICIAHRGDWHSFPENSVEAVNAALDFDAVSVDVRLTSDGKPVLMADETVDRMCVNSDGSSVKGAVSSFTLAQLKEFFLRESNGGSEKGKTDCRVAELKEIYAVADGKTAVVLNISEADFKTVYDYVTASARMTKRFTESTQSRSV